MTDEMPHLVDLEADHWTQQSVPRPLAAEPRSARVSGVSNTQALNSFMNVYELSVPEDVSAFDASQRAGAYFSAVQRGIHLALDTVTGNSFEVPLPREPYHDASQMMGWWDAPNGHHSSYVPFWERTLRNMPRSTNSMFFVDEMMTAEPHLLTSGYHSQREFAKIEKPDPKFSYYLTAAGVMKLRNLGYCLKLMSCEGFCTSYSPAKSDAVSISDFVNEWRKVGIHSAPGVGHKSLPGFASVWIVEIRSQTIPKNPPNSQAHLGDAMSFLGVPLTDHECPADYHCAAAAVKKRYTQARAAGIPGHRVLPLKLLAAKAVLSMSKDETHVVKNVWRLEGGPVLPLQDSTIPWAPERAGRIAVAHIRYGRTNWNYIRQTQPQPATGMYYTSFAGVDFDVLGWD